MKQYITQLPPTTNASFKVGRGRFYETVEYREYVQYVNKGFKTKFKCIEDSPIKLYIAWHISRDSDIDSRLKPFLDSLNGVLYKDDKQVVAIDMIKVKVKKAQQKVVFSYKNLEDKQELFGEV